MIWKQAIKCTLLSGKLYKLGKVYPIREHETIMVLAEVHKGAYNSHISGKALAHNLLRWVLLS